MRGIAGNCRGFCVSGPRRRSSARLIDILSDPGRTFPKNSQCAKPREGDRKAFSGNFRAGYASYLVEIISVICIAHFPAEKWGIWHDSCLYQGRVLLPPMGDSNRGAFSPRWSVEGSPDADSLTSRRTIRLDWRIPSMMGHVLRGVPQVFILQGVDRAGRALPGGSEASDRWGSRSIPPDGRTAFRRLLRPSCRISRPR